MNPLRIFLMAALFVAILGTVSNDVEASLVEVYVDDVDLATSEEDVTIENETDLELIIRLKGDYRMESENDGMSVQSIRIDVSFLNDEDPRDSVLGYPEYQPLGDNESDPGYDEVRSLFRSNSTFEGYTGELGLSIIMKNRTGSIIWDGYFNIVMILKERPDLYISELSFSKNNPEIGEEVTITATIKVLGVNVTDNFSVGFYLGAIPSENGTEIGSQEVHRSKITVGIEYQYKASVNWTAIAGSHTIYVVVDSTNIIDESEEKNDISKVIIAGYGCTDSTAINFVQKAVIDNGSCKYAPIASASHWNDISNDIRPGENVQFNGEGSDEDGTLVLYEWDFNGDGEFDWSGSNGETSYRYMNVGTYNATLRVTDNDGFTATDSRVITVSEEDEEDESSLPSVSMIPALISIGLIAIFRRK